MINTDFSGVPSIALSPEFIIRKGSMVSQGINYKFETAKFIYRINRYKKYKQANQKVKHVKASYYVCHVQRKCGV